MDGQKEGWREGVMFQYFDLLKTITQEKLDKDQTIPAELQ